MPGHWNAHSDRDFEDPHGLTERDDRDEPMRNYSCDCCGRKVTREQIANVMAYGIETAACDRCRGVEEDDG